MAETSDPDDDEEFDRLLAESSRGQPPMSAEDRAALQRAKELWELWKLKEHLPRCPNCGHEPACHAGEVRDLFEHNEKVGPGCFYQDPTLPDGRVCDCRWTALEVSQWLRPDEWD